MKCIYFVLLLSAVFVFSACAKKDDSSSSTSSSTSSTSSSSTYISGSASWECCLELWFTLMPVQNLEKFKQLMTFYLLRWSYLLCCWEFFHCWSKKFWQEFKQNEVNIMAESRSAEWSEFHKLTLQFLPIFENMVLKQFSLLPFFVWFLFVYCLVFKNTKVDKSFRS